MLHIFPGLWINALPYTIRLQQNLRILIKFTHVKNGVYDVKNPKDILQNPKSFFIIKAITVIIMFYYHPVTVLNPTLPTVTVFRPTWHESYRPLLTVSDRYQIFPLIALQALQSFQSLPILILGIWADILSLIKKINALNACSASNAKIWESSVKVSNGNIHELN